MNRALRKRQSIITWTFDELPDADIEVIVAHDDGVTLGTYDDELGWRDLCGVVLCNIRAWADVPEVPS